MKLPRDIRGEELAKLLSRFGYVITRQTGSHLRLTRTIDEEHHITIPRHKNLKIGTLHGIIRNVAENLGKSKEEILIKLFSKD